MATHEQITDAFYRLYEAIREPSFSKGLTPELFHWNEKDLLPLVRTYLFGYFDQVEPEANIKLEGDNATHRIDFIVDDSIAVEFAVKTPSHNNSVIASKNNEKEIKKLMAYNGVSMLVLFDFFESANDDVVTNRLNKYAQAPLTLGERYPYWVVYYYKNTDGEVVYQKRHFKKP